MNFRELHQPGNPFILANAWDIGSAKLFAALGAKALATTSAGHAFTLGVKDMGRITREQSLSHARDLVQASKLPVSGDFENGYGHDSQTVAETVRLAAEVGLAGCSIEDSMLPDDKTYPFQDAVERIEAAAEAARSLDRDFVLTARADGVMNGQYDTAEAIRRIQGYHSVGADVVYVPMPPSFDALAEICRAVDTPVNALAAGPFLQYSRQDFARIGVARISLGSAMARATHTAIIKSAQAMFDAGDFTTMQGSVGAAEIEKLFDSLN
jgi:2-methylisocitrate lyase-like PEP mutase family enzyme